MGDAHPGACRCSSTSTRTDERTRGHRRHRQGARARSRRSPAPLTALRKVGQPYVNAYLDDDTRTSGYSYFPLFMLFVIVLNWLLYRSLRTLLAFVITLGVSRGADGRLRRRHRRHLHHRLVAGADDHPHHLHRDAGLPALALRRGPRRRPRHRRAPGLRAGQQVPRLHGVDLRHRGRLRGAGGLRDPPDPRDGALGGRRAWSSPGSSSSRSSRRCRRSCARRPSRSARSPASGSCAFTELAAALVLSLALAAGARRARPVRASARSRSSASPACSTPMQLRDQRRRVHHPRLGALQGHQAARGADRRPVDHRGVAAAASRAASPTRRCCAASSTSPTRSRRDPRDRRGHRPDDDPAHRCATSSGEGDQLPERRGRARGDRRHARDAAAAASRCCSASSTRSSRRRTWR